MRRSDRTLGLATGWLIILVFASPPVIAAGDEQPGEVRLTPRSTDITLSPTARRMTFTLEGPRDTGKLRLRTPHIGRVDDPRAVFRSIDEVEAVDMKLDRLSLDPADTDKRAFHVDLRQRSTLRAGRYKLVFELEDERSGALVSSSTVFIRMPTRIAVGRPIVESIDTLSDPRRVSALIRFPIQANVQAVQVHVVSTDLGRVGAADRLAIDADEAVEMWTRKAAIDGRAERARVAWQGVDGRRWRSETVGLEHRGWAGIDDELYVCIWWSRGRGGLTPAGRYDADVALMVMPEAGARQSDKQKEGAQP